MTCVETDDLLGDSHKNSQEQIKWNKVLYTAHVRSNYLVFYGVYFNLNTSQHEGMKEVVYLTIR